VDGVRPLSERSGVRWRGFERGRERRDRFGVFVVGFGV